LTGTRASPSEHRTEAQRRGRKGHAQRSDTVRVELSATK
jgi:hypothetical protein